LTLSVSAEGYSRNSSYVFTWSDF